MKKPIRFALLIAALGLFIGGAAAEELSKHVIDSRIVRVKLDGVIDLKLRQGSEPSLQISGDKRYADYAVLYQANSQSRDLLEQFINYRIPYKIVGGVRFYERREIKDLLAYLRVILNPYDGLSMRRISRMEISYSG